MAEFRTKPLPASNAVSNTGNPQRHSFQKTSSEVRLDPYDIQSSAQADHELHIRNLQGAQKLAIELDGDSKTVKYIEKYASIVIETSMVLRKTLQDYAGKEKEEKFIKNVWDLMQGDLRIRYGLNSHNSMSEALDSMRFDCTNSSFFVHDVAEAVGVKTEIILALLHMLVKTENFCFEPTKGQHFPFLELASRYPGYQILKSDEPSAIAYNVSGNMLSAEGELGRAAVSYLKAIELNPEFAEAYYDLGTHVYACQGMMQKAIACFQKTVDLKPAFAEAHYNLAASYYRQGDYGAAIDCLNEVVDLKPKDSEAHLALGFAHLHEGNLGNAISCFFRFIF